MTTVLHLIDTPGPGGAETIFLDLVMNLRPQRYRSIAVVPQRGWLLEHLEAAGCATEILPVGSMDRWEYLRSLVALIRRVRPDLLHAHLTGSAFYASIAGALLRVPRVSTFHGPADMWESDRLRIPRFWLIGALSSRTVFVSRSLRRVFLDKTPLRENRTEVIYNGIDVSAFAVAPETSLRAELRLPSDVLLLGAVGNIRVPKGYEHLMEAVARLKESSTKWHLVVVGDAEGPEFPPLARLVSALGLSERVTFMGFRDDVPAIMQSLDIFVLSSVTEGFSLASVQALAAGVPIVATRSGGPEEILRDAQTALLVPVADPAALAEALERLMLDASLRARLGKAGPEEAAARFSSAAMVTAYERLYERMLDRLS